MSDLRTIEPLLGTFVSRSREILGDHLLGIYLHGSAVMGCFHPAVSDIDLIVLVRHTLPDAVKRAFMDMTVELNASAPAKGIEMSIVRSTFCRPFVYPTPFELHFSETHLAWYREHPDDYIQKMKGTDPDLAAHFTVIRKRGQCLFGLPIEEAFGEVPRADYLDSIWKDICHADEEITENTMYLTLNLARVLAFLREGSVLSKKEGGQWAILHLPETFHPLIHAALSEYAGEGDVVYDPETARAYADAMLCAIRDTVSPDSQ